MPCATRSRADRRITAATHATLYRITSAIRLPRNGTPAARPPMRIAATKMAARSSTPRIANHSRTLITRIRITQLSRKSQHETALHGDLLADATAARPLQHGGGDRDVFKGQPYRLEQCDLVRTGSFHPAGGHVAQGVDPAPLQPALGFGQEKVAG